MNIVTTPQRSEQPPKIWHKKPTDIVKLLNNDGAEPDQAYYMVVKQEHSSTTILNMHTRKVSSISCAIRCVEYEATLNIGNRL